MFAGSQNDTATTTADQDTQKAATLAERILARRPLFKITDTDAEADQPKKPTYAHLLRRRARSPIQPAKRGTAIRGSADDGRNAAVARCPSASPTPALVLAEAPLDEKRPILQSARFGQRPRPLRLAWIPRSRRGAWA
jgi:hypothetical protein